MDENRGRSLQLPIILILILAALGITVPRLSGGQATEKTPVPLVREEFADAERSPIADPCSLLAEYMGRDDASVEPAKGPSERLRALYEALQESSELTAGEMPQHVRFVIATIPDPIESHFDMDVDAQLGVLQRAAQQHRFLLDRYYLPWQQALAGGVEKQRDLYRNHPGVLLFRKDHSAAPRAQDDERGAKETHQHEDLLFVLLVGETPTSGVHKQALINAIDFVVAWRCGGDQIKNPTVRLLAPFFSGSAVSVRKALERWRDNKLTGANRYSSKLECSKVRFEIFSGSATAHVIAEQLEIKPDVEQHSSELPIIESTFQATVAPDRETLPALVNYLRGRGLECSQIALLAEADTTYGAGISSIGEWNDKIREDSPHDILVVRYPMEIGRLRSEYEKQKLLTPLPSQAAGLQPRSAISIPMNETPHSRDVLPSFSDATVSVTDQRVAHGLAALAARDIRAVIIAGSDPKDVIFLARKVRRHCPDALFCTLEHHVLYTHPEVAREFSGMVVATTYPLTMTLQDWDQPQRFRRMAQFSSSASEGAYNAALVLMQDTAPKTPPPDSQLPWTPPSERLMDYRVPFDGASGKPPVWLMTVSGGGTWPIACIPQSDKSFMYALPSNFSEGSRRLIVVPLVSAIPAWIATLGSLMLAVAFFARHFTRYSQEEIAPESPAEAAGRRGYLSRLFRRAACFARWLEPPAEGSSRLARHQRYYLWTLWGGVLLVQIPLVYIIACSAFATANRELLLPLMAGILITLALAASMIASAGIVGSKESLSKPLAILGQFSLLAAVIGVSLTALAINFPFSWQARREAAMVALRNSDFTSGVSIVTTICFLGLGLCVWAVVQIRRVSFLQTIPIQNPFSPTASEKGTSDEHPERWAYLHERIAELNCCVTDTPLPYRARQFLFVAASMFVIAYLTWERWTPTPENPYADAFVRCGLVAYVWMMLVLYVRAAIVADSLERFLRRLGEGPLAEAFSFLHPRLKAKASTHVFSTPQIPGDLEIPVAAYEKLCREAQAESAPGQPPALMPLSASQIVPGLDDPDAAKELNAELNARASEVARTLQRGELWEFHRGEEGKDLPAHNPRAQAAAFLATQLTLLTRQACTHLQNLLAGLVLMSVLFAITLNSYPFQPRRLLSAFGIGIVLIVAVFGVRLVFVFSRNEIISRLSNTVPNRFSFDRSLVVPVLTYVIIPILASIAIQFPHAGGFLDSLLGGLRPFGNN